MTKLTKAGLAALLHSLYPAALLADATAGHQLVESSSSNAGCNSVQAGLHTGTAADPPPAAVEALWNAEVGSSGEAADTTCEPQAGQKASAEDLQQQEEKQQLDESTGIGFTKETGSDRGSYAMLKLVLVKCKGLGPNSVAEVLGAVGQPMAVHVATQLPKDDLGSLTIA